MKTIPTTGAEIRVLSCLSEGEKSVFEVFKSSRLAIETTRRALLKLTREGVVERRWERGPKNCLKYVYKRNPDSSGHGLQSELSG
jgi:predicted transcriptional regulator